MGATEAQASLPLFAQQTAKRAEMKVYVRRDTDFTILRWWNEDADKLSMFWRETEFQWPHFVDTLKLVRNVIAI